jgi:phosphoglycerol transferase MdoB-like AlkP superfamily enzyme
MLRPFRDLLLLILFWIICFDFHRLAFSLHHFEKLSDVSFGEWFLSFVYSIRVDLATACALSAIPFIFRTLNHYFSWKGFNRLYKWSFFILFGAVIAVHSGEIVAYGEWNHKLNARVFMHLSNPDEVVRTANYSMIFWFFLYALLEVAFGLWLYRLILKKRTVHVRKNNLELLALIPTLCIGIFLQFLGLRGGLQQIPLNVASAFVSNKAIANDISINSNYYFGKEYLMYLTSNIDSFMPKVDRKLADQKVRSWYAYPKEHNQIFLENRRPNVIVIVLEGWSAEAIGSLSETKGATRNFDKLTKSGVLFTDIYSTATTSEIGNSSIFSGNPAVPEVSISMHPDKYRKIHCINEDMETWGYHSSYIFSGDLKYGNIGGYFMDHGFDVVKDESNFPSDLPRGKLNFYDEDLYGFLIKEINQHGEPFLQCAFTGSTHAPYDQPKGRGKVFTGQEADYMNSLVYSDEALGKFMKDCKKYPWYKNTLFVFVSDHGHATPTIADPGRGLFYHVPLLFFGEPIKKSYRGKRLSTVGSQSDIAATLLYQMNGDCSRYPWSKDLMNPKVPQFAFHAIINGYGWVTPKGNFAYHMEQKTNVDDTYKPGDLSKEVQNCHYFLTSLYNNYKEL